MKAGLVKASKAGGALSGASIAWDSQDERRPVIAITVGKGASHSQYFEAKLTA